MQLLRTIRGHQWSHNWNPYHENSALTSIMRKKTSHRYSCRDLWGNEACAIMVVYKTQLVTFSYILGTWQGTRDTWQSFSENAGSERTSKILMPSDTVFKILMNTQTVLLRHIQKIVHIMDLPTLIQVHITLIPINTYFSRHSVQPRTLTLQEIHPSVLGDSQSGRYHSAMGDLRIKDSQKSLKWTNSQRNAVKRWLCIYIDCFCVVLYNFTFVCLQVCLRKFPPWKLSQQKDLRVLMTEIFNFRVWLLNIDPPHHLPPDDLGSANTWKIKKRAPWQVSITNRFELTLETSVPPRSLTNRQVNGTRNTVLQ